MRIVLALLLTLFVTDFAYGWPRLFRRRYNNSYYSYNYSNYSSYGSPQQAAEQKVAMLAARGYGFHPGGGYGGGNAEGWGMGSTPYAAQCNACFYGQRTLAASAQAQAANGTWFSINIYW